MTFWHKLSTAAAQAPGIGSIVALMQRFGDHSEARDVAVPKPHPEHSITFTIAIIALSAKLARSDGAVTVDEVEAFRRIMDVPPGDEDNVRRLFDLAKRDTAGFEAYAGQIGALLADDALLRREVLEGLCVIAAADGVLHEREDAYLRAVAGRLGMPDTTYDHVRGLFFNAPMSPYATLALEPEASNAEIKARHRQLAIENHPDRLIGRGCSKDFVARGEKKLARINAAYDIIARERGL